MDQNRYYSGSEPQVYESIKAYLATQETCDLLDPPVPAIFLHQFVFEKELVKRTSGAYINIPGQKEPTPEL